jgi:hypothetical protein
MSTSTEAPNSAELVPVAANVPSRNEDEDEDAPRKYVRSRIAFPYADLGDAIKIANVVHGDYGGRCSMDQLAASMGQSMKSGAFRTKVSTAQMFAIVENDHGRLHLTDVGRRVVDENTRGGALVEAFLCVDLYRILFEKHQGGVLPRDQGLEAEMADLGVAPKQAERARQAFQRSAEVAGFFRLGRDRLVAPPGAREGDSIAPVASQAVSPDSVSGPPPAANFPPLHPLLAGLMHELPQEGEDFSPDKRRDWLDAAKIIFRLVYGKDDGGEEPTSSSN